MGPRTSNRHADRARRFGLRLPVYFRLPSSPTWMVGLTDNISYTGLLLHSIFPMQPSSAVEMRLQLAPQSNAKTSAELQCEGWVVRVEQGVKESSVGMAVAIKDYRIVRTKKNDSPESAGVA